MSEGAQLAAAGREAGVVLPQFVTWESTGMSILRLGLSLRPEKEALEIPKLREYLLP